MGNMDTKNVEKKLREAEFFLNKMREQERRAFGDREPFDFYLSAFLNAGRVVDYRLRHEQRATYEPWRKAWEATLPKNELELIIFLNDERRVEVHESGSGRTAKLEGFEVLHSYSEESGTLEVSGVPHTLGGSGAKATIYKPAYSFTIQGDERRATEVCEQYLLLLKKMLGQFVTENS
jgi:hypothetical protein